MKKQLGQMKNKYNWIHLYLLFEIKNIFLNKIKFIIFNLDKVLL